MLTPDGATFTLTGKAAKLMRSLTIGRPCGITSLDVWRISTRLSAYVHLFRHRHGLVITTEREPHDDGWHARYRLGTRVTVKRLQR